MSWTERARRTSLAVVALLVASTTIGAVPGQALTGDQTITGFVKSGSGTFQVPGPSTPLEGATVTLCVLSDCLPPVVTGPTGAFVIEGVPRNVVTSMSIMAPDHIGQSRSTTFGGPAGPPQMLMDIVLYRAAVKGVVRDDVGAPVANVSVSLLSLGCGLPTCMAVGGTLSGADGSFLVGQAQPSGTYRLQTSTFSTGTFPGPPVDVVVTAGSTAVQDLVVVRAGTIAGQVTDDAGNGVMGATVSAGGVAPTSVPTGIGGFYTLTGLAPGLKTVTITPPGPATSDLVTATRGVTVTSGATTTLDVMFQRGASLEIVVKTAGGVIDAGLDVNAGACPAGAPVAPFCPGVRFAQPTAPGTFRIDALAPGGWTAAVVRAPSFAVTAEASFAAGPGDAVVCTFLGTVGTCAGGQADLDGVDAGVESAGPNGGDGNGDSVADADQLNVTSLPSAGAGAPYVTIAAPGNTYLAAVEAIDPGTLPPPPDGLALPVGLLGFEVRGVALGATVAVVVYLPPGTAATSYLKYDGVAWTDFSSRASFAGDVVTLQLTDGGPGDSDGELNGIIVDPGGPGITRFPGFLSPIDADGLNLVNGGSAVPVKFSLGGDRGLEVLAVGSPTSRQVDCDTGGVITAIPALSTTSKSGLRYDAASDQYTYVWKTQGSWAGTCRELTVTFTNGSSQRVMFAYR